MTSSQNRSYEWLWPIRLVHTYLAQRPQCHTVSVGGSIRFVPSSKSENETYLWISFAT